MAGIRSGASRKCAPVYADSPTNRRSAGRVVGWPGCQPIAGNFRVRADSFAQWQAFRRRHGAKAGRAHDGRASLVWEHICPSFPRRVAPATRFPCLTPRLKSSANQDGWKARKTFDNRRRPPRARGSERHAERDIHKPKMACRCERVKGASMSVRHRARARIVRKGKPPLAGAFVVIERGAAQSAN